MPSQLLSTSTARSSTKLSYPNHQYWLLIPPDIDNIHITQMILMLLVDKESFVTTDSLAPPRDCEGTDFTASTLSDPQFGDLVDYFSESLLNIGNIPRYNPLSFSCGMLLDDMQQTPRDGLVGGTSVESGTEKTFQDSNQQHMRASHQSLNSLPSNITAHRTDDVFTNQEVIIVHAKY